MGAILKAHQSEGHAAMPQAVVFNFDDVSEKANLYLRQIREQAAAIIGDAHEEAKKIRAAAQRDGLLDAQATAEKQVDDKLQQELRFFAPALQEALTEVDRERANWAARWEAQAMELATEMAACVVRREIQQQPQITCDLIAEGLRLACGLGALQLHLHPADAAALQPHLSSLLPVSQADDSVVLIEDENITRGGCRIDTEYGSIDQQFDTQLQRIREELTGDA